MASRRLTLVTLIAAFTLLLTLVNYFYIGNKGQSKSYEETRRFHSSPISSSDHHLTDEFSEQIEYELEQAANQDNLPDRIKEMMRIRRSVMHELNSLESKRTKITSEVSQLTAKYDSVKADLAKKQAEVDRLKSLISQLELLRKEASLREQPFILRPLRLLPSSLAAITAVTNQVTAERSDCSMDSCFDFSRCPLTSEFPVYLYPCYSLDKLVTSANLTAHKMSSLSSYKDKCQKYLDSFQSTLLHVTTNPDTACVFIAILPFEITELDKTSESIRQLVASYLTNLSHWNGNGMNHVLVNLLSPTVDLNDFIHQSQAIIAQPTFNSGKLRYEFDLPIFTPEAKFNHELPLHSPARRDFLASFQAQVSNSSNSPFSRIPKDILAFLNTLQSKTSTGLMKSFYVNLNSNRLENQVLYNSTFSIIIALDKNPSHQFTNQLVTLFSTGTIPVVIGASKTTLPFSEAVDWSKAVILLPMARLTEVNLVLRSFTDADIIQLKYYGRMFYTRHLQNLNQSLATAISILRTSRLQIPPPAATAQYKSHLAYDKNEMKFYEPNNNEAGVNGGDGEWSESIELDEELGPVEPPTPSISFTRNFSLTLNSKYEMFNSEMLDPFKLYPYTPFDPLLPTEARFIGSSYGFRPIGEGAGGSGFEFSRSLGGNLAREQFTIVILTYEREAVLMDTLHRLKGLPYLNKVLVIWNNPDKQPDSDLRWPLIGVPIVVIQSTVNSLNNRFIPYDEIETEAVLSLDDDTHLRHDEIIFAFR